MSRSTFGTRAICVCVAISTYAATANASHAEQDEDDPKLERVTILRPKSPAARFKLTYRYMPMPSPTGGKLNFQGGGFDVYPVSTYVRLGFGADGGYAGGALNAFYADVSVSLGLQYPSWVTPFIEGRFAVGLLGAHYGDLLVPSLLYVAGVEGGLEFFMSKKFFLSGTLGWTHPMYKTPDMVAYAANPEAAPATKRIVGDAFTMKVGFGF